VGVGSGPRLDSLTALRFFAALLIFVHHSTRLWTGPARVRELRTFVFEPMAVGVSFFFILSGFVLTWSARPGQGFGRFEWNRFSRIYPNYLLGFAASLVLVTLGTDWWIRLLNLTMLQAWVPQRGVYFSGNPVSWSLSCEAFFYAVFPLALYVLVRRSVRSQLVTLGVVVVAIYAVQYIAHRLFLGGSQTDVVNGFYLANYFPPARLLEFIVGILLALLFPRIPRIPLLPAIALVVASLYLVARVNSPTKWVVVTLVPIALLIVAAAQSDQAGRRSLLRHRWLILLGAWSYAFYIVHVLVMDLFVRVTGFEATSKREALAATVLVLVCCLAVAALVFSLWERPIERVLRRFHLRRAAGPDEGGTPVGHAIPIDPGARDPVVVAPDLIDLTTPGSGDLERPAGEVPTPG
jgi:peptidoglycan/LPS O-acetylase OafA/YrhL